MRLDELAFGRLGAGADDAVAEGEAGGGGGERAWGRTGRPFGGGGGI